MTDPCSPESLGKARRKIESAAFDEFSDKIDLLLSFVNQMVYIFSRYGFTLNEGFETFTDNLGEEYELARLRSNIHMKRYSQISQDDRAYLSGLSNDIQNHNKFLRSKISENAIADLMNAISYYCNARKDFIKRYGDISEKLAGKHQSKASPSLYYEISNKPEDIFKKSTGQTWSPHNCERYGGESQQGIFSDIEHNSLVVFLRKRRSSGYIARLMLRYCIYEVERKVVKIDGNDYNIDVPKVSVGYDKYWYRGYDSHERFTVNQAKRFVDGEALTAKTATKEVLDIIKKSGFVMDYSECTTPYVHEGYSDVEQKKATTITYSPVYADCPECGEIVPVDKFGKPRCNKCSQRYRCEICRGTFRRTEMAEGTRLCLDCYNDRSERENDDGDDDEEDEEPTPEEIEARRAEHQRVMRMMREQNEARRLREAERARQAREQREREQREREEQERQGRQQ